MGQELTPKQRRQARTREAIIEAAGEIILEKGHDKLSIREVARRIDYTPGALYEYFDGKDAILTAVAARWNLDLAAEMKQGISKQNDARAKLLTIGQTYLDYANDNPRKYRLMTENPTVRRSFDEPSQLPTWHIFLEAIQETFADKLGVLSKRQIPLEGIAYGMWSLAHGLASLNMNHFRYIDAPWKEIQTWSMETFLNGVEAA